MGKQIKNPDSEDPSNGSNASPCDNDKPLGLLTWRLRCFHATNILVLRPLVIATISTRRETNNPQWGCRNEGRRLDRITPVTVACDKRTCERPSSARKCLSLAFVEAPKPTGRAFGINKIPSQRFANKKASLRVWEFCIATEPLGEHVIDYNLQ